MRRWTGLWRRSLQARVVTSTVLLGTLVVGLTGWALLRDIADSLTETRRSAVVVEARSGLDYAQEQLDSSVSQAAAPQAEVLTDMVDSLTDAQAADRTYELVLQGPLPDDTPASAPSRSSSQATVDRLPTSIRRSVARSPSLVWQYATAPVGADDGREVPVVVVGRQLRAPGTGDLYAMYYVFSMEEQQNTLALLRNALLVGGLAMVILVGGVAWLVSRQVLDPIRLARRTAERFARGHLDQRMEVRGEDDLARLSSSFNQMAGSLQNQIRRLEDLSRLQQRFVSDVSHELRTPLTTVRMAGDVLFEARERFDPATARSAELLQAELDRFEALLSDLLDLSRFDAGAAQLELSSIDLSAVARDCVDDALLDHAGIEVRVHGADEPLVVLADRRRVDRIVRNLLSNVVKYSGSDVVDVRVAGNDSSVSLAVRDHGIGLQADENLRVFDRFWRADPARSQAGVGGTGLGLSISREDAALHGGLLQVWGRPHEGAEFVVTLPREPHGDVEPALVSELIA